MINIPLMENNISNEDIESIKLFLDSSTILTQSEQVKKFEEEWSNWLGVDHSVFVNSGSSANLVTMAALRHMFGAGEIIVPTLTWSSDISSILYAGLRPVFVDISEKNLALDEDLVFEAITPRTRAIFLTHILGFNGLSERLRDELRFRNIILIEDVCESHGAKLGDRKLGTFGFASNFSFYYAHHMTTIEGGMISTSDSDFYQVIRMMRSHGMVREATDLKLKQDLMQKHDDLNPQFIFAYPGFNVRNTEINAVMGRSQLKRLDVNNQRRIENCRYFYENLSSDLYWTNFDFDGSVNYAFVVVQKEADHNFSISLMNALQENGVEFRRGSSGGGNQLRQPYLRKIFGNEIHKQYPVTDHIHFFGYYIGNYPSLEKDKIKALCDLLNRIER